MSLVYLFQELLPKGRLLLILFLNLLLQRVKLKITQVKGIFFCNTARLEPDAPVQLKHIWQNIIEWVKIIYINTPFIIKVCGRTIYAGVLKESGLLCLPNGLPLIVCHHQHLIVKFVELMFPVATQVDEK